MHARHLWFGPEQRRLFAWHCSPDDGVARATVVLCAPIGSQASSARPAFQVLSEHLAGAGFASLRLDYDGTGDSSGAWNDAGRLDAWADSIRAAVELARSTGTSRCALVGMRLGALLALEATGRIEELSALVLWDPHSSGREFLREQRLLAAASHGTSQRDDGSVEGPAFVYDKESATEIGALAPRPSRQDPLPPTLLLQRERVASSDIFDELAWKVPLSRFPALGQSELLDVPPDMIVIPEAVIEQIVGWLSSVVDDDAVPLDLETGSNSNQIVAANDRLVTERAVRLGPTALFGIHSSPADAAVRPTIVFLNAGVLEHSGPGRLWTEMARELAAQGLQSVRVDFSGLGDSPARPGQLRNVPKSATEIDDICDLAVALGTPDGSGLVLVGLSSGAYVAVEAALRLRLAAICTINPVFTAVVAESATGRHDPRRLAYRPLPHMLRRLAVHHKRLAETLWKLSAQFFVQASPAGPIVRAAQRGTTVLLVVNAHDVAELTGHGYWWLMRRHVTRKRRLSMHVLPGSDHSLYTRETREAAATIVASWLVDRYVRP